jgi:pyrophosphate--fructose-6-phosphate 1-phosphotransferase
LRVGVVLSGGQAPGGHNVISGLFDALKKLHPETQLIGFLGGPSGILENDSVEITAKLLAPFRNTGGFDLIGSGRTKIETREQFSKALQTAKLNQLDGLVVIGGDDSNTNAALLAEYFRAHAASTVVVGVPKTIDGDLKSREIEISFGCDTACKTFSETVGNILRDCNSAKKYYYFVKLMGRSASHIALECALQTHPNWTFIGEEVAEEGWTLKELVVQLADMVCQRARSGKEYGVVLIPEGIIEFIPEFSRMICELNESLSPGSHLVGTLESMSEWNEKLNATLEVLSETSADCYRILPTLIQQQLLLDRDPHGNVKVSKIETERLFIALVEDELAKRRSKGLYEGAFSSQPHFCGYEGRSCFPSNFDADYCYALGHVAALLVTHQLTGYMSCVSHLVAPPAKWTIGGLPLTSLMRSEVRHGVAKPVIEKALVDLNGAPFAYFKQHREGWMKNEEYLCPGPVQYFGPPELTDRPLITLQLEQQKIEANV